MTHAMFTRTLVALFAALALVLPARAADEHPKAAQTHVILVGVSKYAEDSQIKPRPHAEDDAKALYDVFIDKKYLGADPKNVHLLLGSEDAKRNSEPATQKNILKVLHDVAEKADTNDLVLFAFFGEGGPLGDSGDRRCYFAADSTFKGRDKDAVAADSIGDALKNLKSRQFTVFLDVDFKGFEGTPGIAEPTLGQAPYKEFLGDDGTEDNAPLPGRVVFLATLGLSTSLDLKDNGLFATALLEGLKGAADKDGEPDGSITIDELSEFVEKRVPELARENGKTKKEKEQQPYVLGGRSSHYVLTHNPDVMPKVEKQLAALDALAKKGLKDTYVTEGKVLLGRMPRLEAQRKLRKQYQALVDGTSNEEKFEEERSKILASTKMKRGDALEFSQKVLEAIDLIDKKYYKEINKGEMVDWAITGLYKSREEKIPEDIATQLKDVKTLKTTALNDLLTDARLALGVREDLDKHKDIDITLQRMLSHLDPYTTYIDPESKGRFKDEIDGSFTGIGIQIRKDTVTDMLMVVTPLKGSPAYKAGLEAGDIITTIIREKDGKGDPLPEAEKMLSTKGMPLNEAVKKILGKPGTNIKLKIKREGREEDAVVEITRGSIVTECVMGYKRKENDEWDYYIDHDTKIAYVRLTVFQKNSDGDMRRVMTELKKQNVKGVILDLRFDPGGLLGSAVRISDLFTDGALIVSIRPRVGEPDVYRGKAKNPETNMTDFPMVCLVNGGSASASEIVSAALQDNKRAYIIGERSYGKGSVQNIEEFDNGDLKMTVATFWRPSGKNLYKAATKGRDEDEWGVTPDLVVKLSAKERGDLQDHLRESEIIQPKNRKVMKDPKPEFKDKQLDAALEYLRKAIKDEKKAEK